MTESDISLHAAANKHDKHALQVYIIVMVAGKAWFVMFH